MSSFFSAINGVLKPASTETLVESTVNEGFLPDYHKEAKHALTQAVARPIGSEEYHKWMTVHHKAASFISPEHEAFHSEQSEAHADRAGNSEAFHNGESHHWQ